MAKCEICGKGVTFGIKVSHSHRRSNRTWKPNVKRVKAIVKGTPCHMYVCSRCLRKVCLHEKSPENDGRKLLFSGFFCFGHKSCPFTRNSPKPFQSLSKCLGIFCENSLAFFYGMWYTNNIPVNICEANGAVPFPGDNFWMR